MSYKLIVYTQTEGDQQVCAGIQIELHGCLHLSHDNRYSNYLDTLDIVLSKTTKNDSAMRSLNDLRTYTEFYSFIELDLSPILEDINVYGLSFITFNHPIFSSIKF